MRTSVSGSGVVFVLTLALIGCGAGSDGTGTEDAAQVETDAAQAGYDAGVERGGTSSDGGTTLPGSGPGSSQGGLAGAEDAGGSQAGSSRDASATGPREAGTGQTGPDAAATPDSAVAPNGSLWKPKPGTTWQWDLSGKVTKLDVAADVYDIDGFENDATVVSQLHSAGKKVICYLSVGTYEPDRPDAKDFPKAVLGKYWAEWNETYVDIRSEGLRNVMKKRLDMCQSKGFDGVEPDNMDMFEGGQADTGFPLTEADGIAYAKWLASEAHARGMSIGQKNASSIASAIEGLYDWALTEDCFADGWCDDMKSYTDHGKAMFMCEYTDTNVDFAAACTAGKARKFSPILKGRDLDSAVQFCK